MCIRDRFRVDIENYHILFGLIVFYVTLIRLALSLIHISEPTRRTPISYAVFCLKKITKLSPLNNFLKIPDIVIVNKANYKKKWFNFAKTFGPGKALSLKGRVRDNSLKVSLIRVV